MKISDKNIIPVQYQVHVKPITNVRYHMTNRLPYRVFEPIRLDVVCTVYDKLSSVVANVVQLDHITKYSL